MSKKNSVLYKASDIKLLIPEVIEAGLGIVPTSSTINQLSIGDALAVSALNKKKISKIDFKNFHPSGNLGTKLRTVEELMITGNKIPFVSENLKMKKAFQIISSKKLGTLIVQNNKKITTGIITDGQIRRFNETANNLQDLTVKRVMTSSPISVDRDMLAEKALSIMNSKKITSLCVHNKKNKNKTIGILHIHNVLQSNIH
jgi:arabinose-5-phosphate isomerase